MIQNLSFLFFFWHFINQPQNQPFLTILSHFRFCKWPFSPFFKILSFLGYWVFSVATFFVEMFRIVLEFLPPEKRKSRTRLLPTPKSLLRPITAWANSTMSQSEFLIIACNLLKVRENNVRLVLLLIGWKTGARFLSQSPGVAVAITSLLSRVIWKLLEEASWMIGWEEVINIDHTHDAHIWPFYQVLFFLRRLPRVLPSRGDWFRVNAIPITMPREIQRTGNERCKFTINLS